MKNEKLIEELFNDAGIKAKDIIMLHASFKKIRTAFDDILPEEFISDLLNRITTEGSLIVPAFTYCFKKTYGSHEIFNILDSPSKVGIISESFRKMEGVIRTSSPTHSFSLWGKVTKFIDQNNSPESPLGKGSVLEWFSTQSDSHLLFLGTDFNSFTFGHYLEVIAPVPWSDFSPWDHLDVEKAGISTEGIVKLKELPGCSKSFINFENYLLRNNTIKKKYFHQLDYYYLDTEKILKEGLTFFRNNYRELLCPEGTCKACDSRRRNYL